MSRDDRYLSTAQEPAGAQQPTALNDADEEATTIDAPGAMTDAELEPSSLELLYRETVGRGDSEWLDEHLRRELAQTARLASEATRSSRPPARGQRIAPPRPVGAPGALPPAGTPPPPAVGSAALPMQWPHDLGRVSQSPRPLGEAESAETLESLRSAPSNAAAERSLAPLSLAGEERPGAPAEPRPRGSAEGWRRAGWLAVAALTGALVMAWFGTANRAHAVGSHLGRLGARIAAPAPAPASCGADDRRPLALGGQCSAAAGAEGPTVAAPPARMDGPGDSVEPAPAWGAPSIGTAGRGYVPAAALGAPATVGTPTSLPAIAAGATGDDGRTAPPAEAVAPAEPLAEPTAESPAPLPAFDVAAARSALADAALSAASACPGGEEGTQLVPVAVTFAPSGRATSAIVTGSVYRGTPVGGCIAQVMRTAKVPPFAGEPVTVQRTVAIR